MSEVGCRSGGAAPPLSDVKTIRGGPRARFGVRGGIAGLAVGDARRRSSFPARNVASPGYRCEFAHPTAAAPRRRSDIRHPTSAAGELHAEGVGGAAIPGDQAEARSPLALLVAGHLIPDGEVVLLLIKPSMWLIPLSSMMTLGVAAVIGIGGKVFEDYLPGPAVHYVNAAILLASARLMAATLAWMGRYYVLTDVRIMALSGVFSTQVYQVPLRKVARVRILRTFRERLLSLGNLEIIPTDEDVEIGTWWSVSRPREVRDKVARAIARAKGR